MTPKGFVAVTRYDRVTGAATKVSLPISPAHYYTMRDLGVRAIALFSKKIVRGDPAPGDILYIRGIGGVYAHQCVVVTRVTPAQVHTVTVEGVAQFNVIEEPGESEKMEKCLVLDWTADPARRTTENNLFRWSKKHDAYIQGGYELVRARDTRTHLRKIETE